MAISDTILSPFNIEGYSLGHRSRVGLGGDVGMYINFPLNYKIRSDFECSKGGNFCVYFR